MQQRLVGDDRVARQYMAIRDQSDGGSQHQSIDALIAENVDSILSDELKTRAQAPRLDRAVGVLAAFCGTIPFLACNIGFFAIWIAVNQSVWKFDPFPHTLLMFAVSLEAVVLSILVLIGQNMATAESERRHHLDLQINLLNEREMTALLRLTGEIAVTVGVAEHALAEVREFAHNTDPASVLKQITEAEALKKSAGTATDETPRGAPGN